jgi:hypothetical protein
MFTSCNFCSTCHVIQNMGDVISHFWLMPSNKTVMPKSNFVKKRHTGQNFRPRYVGTFYTPTFTKFWVFQWWKMTRDLHWIGQIAVILYFIWEANVLKIDLENSWSQFVWVSKSLMLIVVTANFLSRHRRSFKKYRLHRVELSLRSL